MRVTESQYHHLLSEIGELDRMIAMAPPEAVISRKSLEYRREQVQRELDDFPVPARWPATVRLTFDGEPVEPGGGIDAGFGAKAVQAFTEVVSSTGAGQAGTLKDKGPIPRREDYRLRITGPAFGSFGFELEEVINPGLIINPSPVESAITRVKEILKESVSESKVPAEDIMEIHPRALTDLRGFLKLMVDNRAVCGLSFRGDQFRFKDVDQVRNSLNKLSVDYVRQGEMGIRGFFKGYLPESRRAEFLNYATGEVIPVKVAVGVRNPGAINRLLNRDVFIRIHFQQIGNRRPQYTVVGYDTSP